MNTELFVTFVLLSVANVIIQTIKSIATIKCGKTAAALVNAVAYGLYTVVTVYTMCDLALWLKVLVVALSNLVGVYIVKAMEEKAQKDKLWKVEATFTKDKETLDQIVHVCEVQGIPMNWIDLNKYMVINFYCATKSKSAFVKTLIEGYNGKYFASETKTL